jgi:hypothetical protein
VPLGLVTNGKQVLRELNRLAPEIIEITRHKDILSIEIGFDVLRAVHAGALNRGSTGIIIDAVAEAFRQIGAVHIGYPWGQSVRARLS